MVLADIMVEVGVPLALKMEKNPAFLIIFHQARMPVVSRLCLLLESFVSLNSSSSPGLENKAPLYNLKSMLFRQVQYLYWNNFIFRLK